MIRRPPRSTLFPYRRSSDLRANVPEEKAPRAASIAACQRGPGAGVLVGGAPCETRGPNERWINDLTADGIDRKSTRLNSSHSQISYAVFCLKKKKKTHISPI